MILITRCERSVKNLYTNLVITNNLLYDSQDICHGNWLVKIIFICKNQLTRY